MTDEEVFLDDPERIDENTNIDIAGTFEIQTVEEDSCDDSDDEPLAAKRRKIMASDNEEVHRKIRNEEATPKWRIGEHLYNTSLTSNEAQKIEVLHNELGEKSPLELFFIFFDDEVINMIVDYSLKYATDNNRHDFEFTRNDLLNFIGIMTLSGYHTLPQAYMYWSSEDDKGLDIVKQCMSKNRFKSIKRNLHLADNSNLDKSDKFAKLRPFFNIMNKKFMQFDVFAYNLSIDEQMVPYFGRHSCKMYIKGKPVKFGFKLWCLCSAEGYLYQFMPYGGANLEKQKNEYGLGTQVVLDLLSFVKDPEHHNIFFDNFFSSYKLFTILKQRGYFATGTIRENRTNKCPLESSKSISKKKRGSFSCVFDESMEISLVRWNDNSIVTLISTHYNVEPLATAKRFNKKSGKMENIPQPVVISNYNKFMGGVDLHDNGVANYRTRILGKKWWWPLFVNTVDSTLVNAWKLYNLTHDKKMSQINFKSYIALRLLKLGANKPKPKCTTSYVPNEVRTHESGHLIVKDELKVRRRCKVCHSQTIYMCKRCNVHIHADCFNEYHSK